LKTKTLAGPTTTAARDARGPELRRGPLMRLGPRQPNQATQGGKLTDGARPSYTRGAGELLRRVGAHRRRLLRRNRALPRVLHVTPHLGTPFSPTPLHRNMLADGPGGRRRSALVDDDEDDPD
jgi:hypothetical protein